MVINLHLTRFSIVLIVSELIESNRTTNIIKKNILCMCIMKTCPRFRQEIKHVFIKEMFQAGKIMHTGCKRERKKNGAI